MKIKKNEIIFASVAQELSEDVSNIMPKPQRYFIPSWFKKVKSVDSGESWNYISKTKTVRKCPSFVEIWNEGFVITAPTDYLIKVNTDGTFQWKTAYSFEKYQQAEDVEQHYNVQMIDYYPDKSYKKILKLQLPYRVYTANGVSCRQTPLMFQDNQNKDWEVPHGIVRTDKVHELNVQLIIKTFDEIVIPKGTPLCVYAPFKRQQYKHKNLYLLDDKNLLKHDQKNYVKMFGTFKSNSKFYWSE